MGNYQSTVELPETVIELIGLIFNKDLLGNDKAELSKCYAELNTKIECLSSDSEDYINICKYITNTHGPTHYFKLKVRNIFSIYRKGEYWEYKPNKTLGNRKLLWHGSKISNYPSILKNGLLTTPPSNVSTHGKMFGNGVYFTDVVTKAAQYCGASRFSPSSGILILAEVALGKHYYRTKGETIDKLPDGKNSVKGLGKYKPKRTEIIKNQYGTQIPLGPLEYYDDLTTDLQYSEYIVYNNNQIFMQYLVHVDFEYQSCVIQ